MRPWANLYTKQQAETVMKALGNNSPVPSKGKTTTFSLPAGSTYSKCRVEWTEHRSDSKINYKTGKNAGERLYLLTQYNEGTTEI